ncbi:MAG: hypothetical protein ACOX2L_03475 [Anaerolineae bacterium]|jgi:predicted  nucleic acid-binding Zn-ribbon protein|nr:hypothetical protein [Chloroflexota bacterium]
MPEPTFWQTVLSPPVLLTIMACALVTGVLVWLRGKWTGRQQQAALSEQRKQQEATVERLLEATNMDKQRVISNYEQTIRERDTQVAKLEREVARLRDRLAAGGVVGVFGGGRQRDVVSALLLENEQLHELLADKQAELRDLMADMTGKLVDRLDAQAQESARAVRYKQALLSAFLEREETRQLLGNMLAHGEIAQDAEVRELPPEAPTAPQQ